MGRTASPTSSKTDYRVFVGNMGSVWVVGSVFEGTLVSPVFPAILKLPPSASSSSLPPFLTRQRRRRRATDINDDRKSGNFFSNNFREFGTSLLPVPSSLSSSLLPFIFSPGEGFLFFLSLGKKKTV